MEEEEKEQNDEEEEEEGEGNFSEAAVEPAKGLLQPSAGTARGGTARKALDLSRFSKSSFPIYGHIRETEGGSEVVHGSDQHTATAAGADRNEKDRDGKERDGKDSVKGFISKSGKIVLPLPWSAIVAVTSVCCTQLLCDMDTGATRQWCGSQQQ